MPSISQLIALSGRRIARMYPMIGKRQKLSRKAEVGLGLPGIEDREPDAGRDPEDRQTEDEASEQP